MKTTEYKYYKFDFDEFNPAQVSVIPHVTEDNNLIVSFPTSTGKTAIAESAIGYHFSRGEKCIYISPYRSLSMQKYDEWEGNENFINKKVFLCSSDNTNKDNEFIDKDLVLFTLESFDSKTRSKQYQEWLKTIKLIVIDEAHILGQKNRGDRLEASLMRFTYINPDSRIILLSATMSNVKQLTDWVKKLNGKKSLWFNTKWKPAKRVTKLFEFPENWREKIEAVTEKSINCNGKTIVFVHSKKLGKEIAKEIYNRGYNCAFHHSGLMKARRKKIEKAFNDEYSGLNIIVSTSTLSSGVNIG